MYSSRMRTDRCSLPIGGGLPSTYWWGRSAGNKVHVFLCKYNQMVKLVLTSHLQTCCVGVLPVVSYLVIGYSVRLMEHEMCRWCHLVLKMDSPPVASSDPALTSAGPSSDPVPLSMTTLPGSPATRKSHSKNILSDTFTVFNSKVV